MVTALPDSPLLRLVKSMERETFSPIGRVPASEAGPAFSEPGLVGEGGTVRGAVNSGCGIISGVSTGYTGLYLLLEAVEVLVEHPPHPS